MFACRHECVHTSVCVVCVMITSPEISLNGSTRVDLLHSCCKLLQPDDSSTSAFNLTLFFMAPLLLIPMGFSLSYFLSDVGLTPLPSLCNVYYKTGNE